MWHDGQLLTLTDSDTLFLYCQAVLNGIDSVKKVIDRLKSRGDTEAAEGYFGTLIENFTCDKKFYTCVEVTAGSRLVVMK